MGMRVLHGLNFGQDLKMPPSGTQFRPRLRLGMELGVPSGGIFQSSLVCHAALPHFHDYFKKTCDFLLALLIYEIGNL